MQLTEKETISLLIVDDEKKACSNLQGLLHNYIDSELNIVGQANNTNEAEDMIRLYRPDAIFLDIEMPNENAFHFLQRITPFPFEVVFVTSYDEHAIRAFRLNALDYILKPVSIDELETAVNKIKEKVRYKKLFGQQDTSLPQMQQYTGDTCNRIVLRETNGIEIVGFEDIYYVEAQSSYARICFRKNDKTRYTVVSNPLSDYEELLPSRHFQRVHRSFLINCAQIERISMEEPRTVLLKNGCHIPISRRRFNHVLEFLKSHSLLHE